MTVNPLTKQLLALASDGVVYTLEAPFQSKFSNLLIYPVYIYMEMLMLLARSA